MKRLIIVGSPRVEGRSGALADLLFESCIEECPEDEVFLRRCPRWKWLGATPATGASGKRAEKMLGAMTATRLPPTPTPRAKRTPIVGASSATIWTTSIRCLRTPTSLLWWRPCTLRARRRSSRLCSTGSSRISGRASARGGACTLHVVGEGGDPHGFDPLVGTVRSAAAVAGFRLERVLDWVGKIDESGEIVAEADEYPISGPVVRAFAGGASAAAVEPVEAPAEQPAAPAESAPEAFAENDFAAQLASQAARRQQRARLDLGENGSERQVIKLDEEGRRVDAAQHGRKRSAQKKHANAKRGTNGVQQAKHDNPHAQKGKGGGKAGGAKGGNANRGGKQGKRRG